MNDKENTNACNITNFDGQEDSAVYERYVDVMTQPAVEGQTQPFRCDHDAIVEKVDKAYDEEVFNLTSPVVEGQAQPSNVCTEDGEAIRYKDLRRAVGGAIAEVDGVLGLKGGFTDIFKKCDDLTRGITVHADRDQNAQVEAKLIVDANLNPADVLRQVTQSVTSKLQHDIGLAPQKLNIQIIESLTPQQFEEKYGPECFVG